MNGNKLVKIELGDVTPNNVQVLKLLNIITLPVRYTDKFYKDLVAKPPDFLKLAYVHGFAVGDVCARYNLPFIG